MRGVRPYGDSNPMSQRVLLTGNAGYLGTSLVTLLRERGHVVQGIDAYLFRDCALRPFMTVPTLDKDIREIEREDVEGFDAVIHLAGLSNDPMGSLNPEVTYEINYEATVRLAELAKAAGVRRFLYASSCSVYGSAGEGILTEDSPQNPVTPYAKSKVLSEEALTQLADETFAPTFLRPATAYGVSPMIRFDLVLNNLVAWACATGKVLLKSDGGSWRPVVHAEDIGRAYVAVLEAPVETVWCRAYNVGRDDDNFRIRDLARVIVDGIPGSKLEFAEGAGPDKRSYRVSFERIHNELPSFQPQFTAARGTQEVLEAISSLGLSTDDFEGARYNRLDHLKHLMNRGLLDERLRRTWPSGQERRSA